MPTYEFHCRSCGKNFALIMSLKERETLNVKCGFCGSTEVSQQLSAVTTKTSRKT